jgi:putative salt-induced outer membrane protein YdiY
MRLPLHYLLSLLAAGVISVAGRAQDDPSDGQFFRLPPPPEEAAPWPTEVRQGPAITSPENKVEAPAAHAAKPNQTAQRELVPAPSPDSSVVPSIVDSSYWKALWDPWDGNVEFGMNGTGGNTETFNMRLGATAKHKTDSRNDSFQIVYIEKTANQIQTAHSALADGRIEWPWAGSPWNYFIHSLVEYDEFKAFHVRLSGDTGLGYEFIQTDQTTLIGRFGIAASREIGGPDNSIQPELLLGGEYKHKFSDKHSISFKADYYPAFDNFSDFRLNSQAAWEMAVAPEWGLSLKIAVIDRYDSTPHGAKPNDLDYSTLLIWAF